MATSKFKRITTIFLVIALIICIFFYYKIFLDHKRPNANITISDELILGSNSHHYTSNVIHNDKGVSINAHKVELDIDRTELHRLIWDLRRTEANVLGNYEWIPLDNYSINQELFTLDETYPIKIHQMESKESNNSMDYSLQYPLFAWTSKVNLIAERTVTAINLARFQIKNIGEGAAELYFGIDDSLTIEYNPGTNKVRLNKSDKGLTFSNLQTLFQIDEKELFNSDLFEGHVRKGTGMKFHELSRKNRNLGNYEHQIRKFTFKYGSKEQAMDELNKSRGSFKEYSIVMPDDYIYHQVGVNHDTKATEVEVEFKIE